MGSTTLYNSKYASVFNNGTDVFATSFDWSITFFHAPAIFGSDGTKDLADDFLNKQLLLKTVSWSAPDIPDQQSMSVNIHGHNLSQPGLASNSGQVSIQYMDTASLNVCRYFNSVMYAMDDPHSHTTRGRSPNSFRYGFYIDKLDPMGNSIMRWMCDPCLLGVVNVDMNGGSSDKNIQGRLTAAFQVDFFKIYYPDSTGKYSDCVNASGRLFKD